MKKIFLNRFVAGFVFGSGLAIAGFPFTTWQYWFLSILALWLAFTFKFEK